MDYLLKQFNYFIKTWNWDTTLAQVVLSVALLLIAFLINKSVSSFFKLRYKDPRSPRLLSALISTRNTVGFATFILIVVLWAGEIRHVVFSIAAIAAALILASKEMWTNFFGMVSRTFVKPFEIGDIIEVANFKGRVIDMDSFTVKVLLHGTAGQTTAKIAEIPNGLFLTNPVINHSPVGKYSFNFTSVWINPEVADVPAHLVFLEEAANEFCNSFLDEARLEIDTISAMLHLELPSVKPRVLIVPKDSKNLCLLLRYPCLSSEKVSSEQKILTDYFVKAKELKSVIQSTV